MLKHIAAALALGAGMAAAEDIKIGVSPGEHAEILEQVAPIAAARGLSLDIIEFSDYVVPNTALADGDLQANSFQHVPYLENQIKDRGYDLVVVAKTITTPMGVYSSKLKSLDDLADGATYPVYPQDRTYSFQATTVAPDQATPLLSDDERAVAVYAAKAYLTEKLQELLPEVLADPAYKPHLEFAARCYLAHLLEKPLTEVSETDLSRLDARIARALGRWH